MTKNDDVAARIIERRAELGWTQDQLAKEAGVAAAQISRYESRINAPRFNIISKLSKAMMVPFSWLAYGDTSELIQEPKIQGCTDFYVGIPKDLRDRLESDAKQNGVSTNDYVIKLLSAQMHR